jgi:hypothetical protein
MHAVDPLWDGWDWGSAEHEHAELAGRRGVRLSGAGVLASPHGVKLLDGVVEADLAVTAGRSFHGIAWRIADETGYESFFVRPHQVGNPDAIQYTPVFNGLSSWQLYHGDGFWRETRFPVGEWFTIRIEFAADRLRAEVAGSVVLEGTRLRRPAAEGAVGVLVGGDDLLLGELRWSAEPPELPPPRPEPELPGVIRRWEVSEPFAEGDLAAQLRAEHRWTALEAEPSGLADLARVARLEDDTDTVFARFTVESDLARRVPLQLGFSDRAVVHVNGEPLYRGDDAYRSRDHRFLGSIGWFDTLYLPLVQGPNEFVVAVSESFGGWGVQARFPDAAGLRLA